MKTSTDWNGDRRSAKPTMIDRTPMIAWRTRLPVSPSRVNDVMHVEDPLTNSQAAKKMAIVTIVAPG